MLKDITLGQFFPGDTMVHRLDARVKLILTIVYITALFIAASYITYGLMFVTLCFSVLLTRIKVRVILRGVRPVVIIVVITAIINVFFTPGDVIFNFWVLKVTREGLITAGFMVLRLLMLMTFALLLTYTTSPIALTDAFEKLLSPLKRIRVPIHELAMMMSIALRFIPTLIDETDKIISAQRSRGADFESGGLIRRAKSLLPLIVPLFVSAFRRADELAVAMESRCYHGGAGRTRLYAMVLRFRDIVALIVGFVLLGSVIVLSRYGY